MFFFPTKANHLPLIIFFAGCTPLSLSANNPNCRITLSNFPMERLTEDNDSYSLGVLYEYTDSKSGETVQHLATGKVTAEQHIDVLKKSLQVRGIKFEEGTPAVGGDKDVKVLWAGELGYKDGFLTSAINTAGMNDPTRPAPDWLTILDRDIAPERIVSALKNSPEALTEVKIGENFSSYRFTNDETAASLHLHPILEQMQVLRHDFQNLLSSVTGPLQIFSTEIPAFSRLVTQEKNNSLSPAEKAQLTKLTEDFQEAPIKLNPELFKFLNNSMNLLRSKYLDTGHLKKTELERVFQTEDAHNRFTRTENWSNETLGKRLEDAIKFYQHVQGKSEFGESYQGIPLLNLEQFQSMGETLLVLKALYEGLDR